MGGLPVSRTDPIGTCQTSLRVSRSSADMAPNRRLMATLTLPNVA